MVDGKTVLVIGGAGGIGSELCRQLIAQNVGVGSCCPGGHFFTSLSL